MFMIWFMIAIMFTGSAFTLCCAIYGILKMREDPLEIYERKMLICAAGVPALNAAAMLAPTEKSALVLFGLYNICETCTALCLLLFVRRYMGITRSLGKIKRLIYVAAAIDAVMMLVNPFFNFLFKVEPYYDKWGTLFYRSSHMMPPYYFHATLTTIIIIANLAMLLRRMIIAPKAYVIKYSSVFLSLATIVSIGTLYIYLDLKFDYSLMLYPLVVFLIFYFSLIYVPRGLMERLMFFTVANMKDGIVCIDIDSKIVHANKAAKDFCEAEIDIQTLDNQVRKWLIEDIDPNISVHIWETTRRINGQKHYFTIEYHRIYDSSVKYLGCFFLIHDRTEEYIKYKTEKYKATHDMLTGLYNMECFCECVRDQLNNDPETGYYIIVTDVKNFKMVNDVFGVEAGDRLLKKISEITAQFGGSDCIYGRLTGDRFSICMPKSRFSEEELLETYSAVDSFLEGAAFKTHIHIGVYEVTDRSLRVSVMCDHANLAIKKIKDSYRSFVAYYDNELRESFINEHKVISEFEKAIEDNQFQPYIQPQIASNGNIMGGEALVRWIHPKEGMIPPDKFIKLFEQTGLISRLDTLMWEFACIQLKRWTDIGLTESYISVNISQKDFYLLDVYNTMINLVNKYDISPKRLHLEITETAIMDNPEAQLELITKLRNCGFIVEIDDFGSGYSSLNMLKEIEADVLKIDMGFLKKSDHQHKSQVILKMIIGLAKSLKMEVITEGVETMDQVKFLAEYGCDIYQGYYFAKPMTINEFETTYLNKRFRI